SLQLRGLTVMPNTALTGEFAVFTCLHGGFAVTCPSLATPFTLTGVNDTLVVRMSCHSANRVAMLDGTLIVTSDLMMNPTRNVPLKCNSTTAGLSVNPSSMVLDFGATDLDAVPVGVPRMITITNNGTATLNLDAGLKTGAANYAVSGIGAQ